MHAFVKFLTLAALSLCLMACGGGGGSGTQASATQASGTPPSNLTSEPPMTPTPVPSARVLDKPVLNFTDTGLSVTDGVTRNGIWEVSTLEGWQYSLDMGGTWMMGDGDFFEVRGDGPKTIWVRAIDGLGNTSEVVVVSCVLDTMPPAPVQGQLASQGLTRLVRVTGLENQARWEYSVDDQRSWRPGTGDSLALMGNALQALWLRQVDVAGNLSSAQQIALQEADSATWHEASGNPLQPSVLSLQGSRTVVLHGSVVRGDPDYIGWDIPAGQQLQSMRLIRYVSSDAIAFFALQRAAVFDAGINTNRMLTHGHMGPPDLLRNVVQAVPPAQLLAGPMTLWFQQTGPAATEYAIELVFAPAP
jgi:hypothetical protein